MSDVPLVDLSPQHVQIMPDLEPLLSTLFKEASFILGPQVEQFEQEFANFAEVRHCIGVANGTDALELALRACGVTRDDEVLIPANTFVATALAAIRVGARPVLVDCDAEYLLMDPDKVDESVGPRTRAIIPVHLYGQAAPVERLSHLIDDDRIALIEDAAQAQGAKRLDVAVGNMGVASATSFYPGKNLGAYGDGGAVLTNNSEIRDRVRRLRNYGGEQRYEHLELGFNSRLDSIQAVVLLAKLKHLHRWNEERRIAAARYDQLLAGIDGVHLPRTLPGNVHVWHLYTVRLPRRDTVLRRLREDGVGAAIHYPLPLHLQPSLQFLGYTRGAFPAAEAASGSLLSLPLYPGIRETQQERVAEALKDAIRTGGGKAS